MKQVFKRALNLLPLWAALGFLDWAYVLVTEQRFNDSLYIALGMLSVTLALNYVFFGVLTVWHSMRQRE